MSDENAIRERDASTGDADDPLIGQLIDGKYRVEKLIGAGGMGRVYRGRNIRTESPVAIKTLLPELVTDESLIKRFEIEAKSASNLRHPNTIRIFDFGREGRLLFMVMELLDGSSLEGVLAREGRVEPKRIVHVMLQVCRSLAEAHEAGLVHRDLKPDNIFLNRAGGETDFVKVLDFGVAKLRDKKYGQATLTQAGMIFGTPRYMSPEQARALDIDARSDIYALGVILFECLTGRPPFEANDPIAVLIKHVQEPPPSFAEVAPDLPPMPALEAIARRCMEKQADSRYPDVRSLMSDLEAAVAPASISTGPSDVSSFATRLMDSAPEPTLAQGKAVRPAPHTPAASAGSKDPTFQLGGNGTVFGDANPAPRRSPLPMALAAVAGVIVVAGIAIVVLVGPGHSDRPSSGAIGVDATPPSVPTAVATSAPTTAAMPETDAGAVADVVPPTPAPAALVVAQDRLRVAAAAALAATSRPAAPDAGSVVDGVERDSGTRPPHVPPADQGGEDVRVPRDDTPPPREPHEPPPQQPTGGLEDPYQ